MSEGNIKIKSVLFLLKSNFASKHLCFVGVIPIISNLPSAIFYRIELLKSAYKVEVILFIIKNFTRFFIIILRIIFLLNIVFNYISAILGAL